MVRRKHHLRPNQTGSNGLKLGVATHIRRYQIQINTLVKEACNFRRETQRGRNKHEQAGYEPDSPNDRLTYAFQSRDIGCRIFDMKRQIRAIGGYSTCLSRQITINHGRLEMYRAGVRLLGALLPFVPLDHSTANATVICRSYSKRAAEAEFGEECERWNISLP